MTDEDKKADSKQVAKRDEATPHALSPFDEMDKMFKEAFGIAWPRSWMHPFYWEFPPLVNTPVPFAGATLPRVDIIENENDIVVRAEVPGVSKDNLEVTTTQNTVTLSGSTRRSEKEDKKGYHRSEISCGSFTRTIALPCQVVSDKVSAKLKNGVLELTLPKDDKAKRKTVAIE
jgi:HSP20 family protein